MFCLFKTKYVTGRYLLQQIVVLLTTAKKENKSSNISSSKGCLRISLVNQVDISEFPKWTTAGLVTDFDSHLSKCTNGVAHLGTQCFQDPTPMIFFDLLLCFHILHSQRHNVYSKLLMFNFFLTCRFMEKTLIKIFRPWDKKNFYKISWVNVISKKM